MSKMRNQNHNTKRGYILKLRQSRTFRGIAMTLALSLIFEMIQPSVSMALTEGPSQPEVQSFEPIGTTQMVDLFTGDFNYNIPLFNLPGPNGGYPVNLAYHAGVSMDDEASWVGLGWNLNVGALVRNMRGLPDEFLSTVNANGDWTGGDYIKTKTDMKASWTLGVNFRKKAEMSGANIQTNGYGGSVYYNNYKGLGASFDANLFGKGNSPFSLGLSLDSDNGLGVSANITLNKTNDRAKYDHDLSLSFNGDVSVGYGIKGRDNGRNGTKLQNFASSSINSQRFGTSLSSARNNFTPSIGNQINSYNLSVGFTMGKTLIIPSLYVDGRNYGVFFNTQDYNNDDKKGRVRPVMGYGESQDLLSDKEDYFTHDYTRLNNGQVTKETPVLPHSYYSFDHYSSSGQGLSGYFRGRRNDIGRVHDPKLRNVNFGVSLGVELTQQEQLVTTVGPYPPVIPTPTPITPYTTLNNHWGLGASINFGWNDQRPWDRKNDLRYDFQIPRPDGIEENLYYQAHGEQTVFDPSDLSYMNGTDLALVKFKPKNTNIFTGGKREILTADNPHIDYKRDINDGRVVRNTLIHTLKNKEVSKLGEFDVKFYDYGLNGNLDFSSEPQAQLNRGSRTPSINDAAVGIENHNAGFKVLNEDGSYYVYGLPAYNTKEVENLFSVETPNNHNDANVVEVDVHTPTNEVEYQKQGTHKFINKTEKSPYAHSYMLTSVQGADYVDIDNNGPSDDDLGYWVKFDYVKYGDNIKWRAPYHGANYSQGQTYTGQDDKGSYQYGEKEQWYLGRMETKSHIAIFEMSERNDMKEAAGEFANTSDLTGSRSGLKIDKIRIYEKSSFVPGSTDNVPLQTVHFEYDYSLCQGVLNNDINASLINPAGNILPKNAPTNLGGKLTLKRVYFTSLNSSRGELSPYEFDYTSVNINQNYQSTLGEGGANDLVNPNYQQNAYDPWGGYKPYATFSNSTNNGTYDGGYQQHANFPYVAQTSQGWQQQWSSLYPNQQFETQANKELTQQANDLIASTWSLREIKLPSGGKINIEYESDDYSHVQHKVANQMFKIVKVGTLQNPTNQLYEGGNENQFYNNDQSTIDEERRRIYFKLEKPLKTGAPNGQSDYADSIFQQYVQPITKDEAGKRNLYFKSRMLLTGDYNSNDNNDKVFEYVRGYLPLEQNKSLELNGNIHYNYGVLMDDAPDLSETFPEDGETYYSIGFITIEPAQRKNGNYFDQYHPMALAAWTYMQTNAQELLNPSSNFNSIGTPSNTGEVLGLFTNILNAVPATAASFGAIRPYCKAKKFAQHIDLANSGIRLASPDRKKFGGGHRVKQITISDNWDSDTGGSETNRTYGQVYDYTIQEDGMTMSSGVAQYEPQAGGDENALKYPIHFYGKNKLFTNNNLFTEAPMNEALFPGAMVGYRQVTVRSLNTSTQMRKFIDQNDTPEGRTGGITEHQFYTSKDFPTRVEWSTLSEDNHTKDVFNLPIVIPFIGSITRNYYHGSQAFKIETNDMHGKPKSVRSFELNGYERNNAPITEAVYEYQSAPMVYQGEQVQRLVSEVQTIPQSGSQDLTNTETRLMGVETDLFTDQRENKSISNNIGLDFNLDQTVAAFFVSAWPSISNNKTMFRTYVTNKVVHRSGIMVRTKTRDLQTVNETEILAYDEKAGTPLVSKVKNEFGDDFYSYNIPAYYHYDRMGHAYRNINYTFTADVSPIDPDSGDDKRFVNLNVNPTNSNVADHLVRGDELLVTDDGAPNVSGQPSNDYVKGYFLGWTYDASGSELMAKIQLIDPVATSNPQNFTFKVIRSGRRNHYGSMAANYLTKGEIVTSNTLTIDGTYQTEIIDGDVLSATASLFKDDWVSTGGSANLNDDRSTNNPFRSGNSGIFRPYKSYTYVGPRSGAADMYDNTTSGTNPELYNDGVMSAVPMFTWDLGNIEEYVQNWEWVNEVTRFSQDAYEVENVNRLGIYSSALYGYDNSLTIAVGGNASTYELGAFDFELGTGGDNLLSQTNMDFDLSQTGGNVITTEQHNIINTSMIAGNTLVVQTDIPAAGFSFANYEDNVGLSLITNKGVAPKTNEGFYFNGIRENTYSTYTNGGNTFVQFNVTPFIETNGTGNDLLPVGSEAHGKITLMSMKSNDVSTPSAEYSTEKAHTGKRSLKITGTSEFDQPQLKLIQGKQYVVSVWMSTDKKKRTYENDGIVTLGTNNVNILTTTYSKVIEGWQKVDFEIEATASNAKLVLNFDTPSGEVAYIDDIRFSPRTGGITTYVYDPDRFWLRASLNVDNYATLFFYDEEGNLTIKKQETEEGIYTITESRGHVSEDN